MDEFFYHNLKLHYYTYDSVNQGLSWTKINLFLPLVCILNPLFINMWVAGWFLLLFCILPALWSLRCRTLPLCVERSERLSFSGLTMERLGVSIHLRPRRRLCKRSSMRALMERVSTSQFYWTFLKVIWFIRQFAVCFGVFIYFIQAFFSLWGSVIGSFPWMPLSTNS